MVTTRESYDAMITSPIGGHLRALGFRKQRNTFFRSTDHGWIAVDFQASQFGTRESVSFTVNLAVNFVELRSTEEQQLSLAGAHIEERLGVLLPEARDFWWSLEPESNQASVANELIETLSRYAIPWLESRQIFSETVVAMRADPNFLEPAHLARLSVLARQVGKGDLSAELRQLSDRRYEGRPERSP